MADNEETRVLNKSCGATMSVSKSLVEEEGWERVEAQMIQVVRKQFKIPDETPVVVNPDRIGYKFEKDVVTGETRVLTLPPDSPDIAYYDCRLHWMGPAND